MNYYALQEKFSASLSILDSKKHYPDQLEKFLSHHFLPLAWEVNDKLIDLAHDKETADDDLMEANVKLEECYNLISQANDAIKAYNDREEERKIGIKTNESDKS